MVSSAVHNFFTIEPRKEEKKNKVRPVCSLEMNQTSESINCSQQWPCFVPESCKNGDSGMIKNKYYQVFVNFRGEELRKHFLSHLIVALERNEINFFIDTNEQRGKDLQNLFVRIKESKIALAIFSPRYTESKWCMDELVKMNELAVEEKLIVIPIFYKVKARDVKEPTIDSEFGRNFKKLIETSSTYQIKKWEEALKCISNKMGVSLTNESSEAQFVKDIVMEVEKVIEAKQLAMTESVVNTFKGFVDIRST